MTPVDLERLVHRLANAVGGPVPDAVTLNLARTAIFVVKDTPPEKRAEMSRRLTALIFELREGSTQ